jgi:hypothetical protein
MSAAPHRPFVTASLLAGWPFYSFLILSLLDHEGDTTPVETSPVSTPPSAMPSAFMTVAVQTSRVSPRTVTRSVSELRRASVLLPDRAGLSPRHPRRHHHAPQTSAVREAHRIT